MAGAQQQGFRSPPIPKRVYLIGYLNKRCRGKVFPFTETAGTSLIQIRPGAQGERVYSPEGVSCTLAAQTGGFGGKTGLYEVGLPIRENTKRGTKWRIPATASIWRLLRKIPGAAGLDENRPYPHRQQRPRHLGAAQAHPPPDAKGMPAAAGMGR